MSLLSRFFAVSEPSDTPTSSKDFQDEKQKAPALAPPIICLCVVVLAALPLMVNSSTFARASFGISGFPQTVSCLIVFIMFAPVIRRPLSPALRWLLTSALVLVVGALIVLEIAFGTLRLSESYASAAHGNTSIEYHIEQGLYTAGWLLLIVNLAIAQLNESTHADSTPRWAFTIITFLFLIQDLCLRVLGLNPTQPLPFTNSLVASEALLLALHSAQAALALFAARRMGPRPVLGFAFASLMASLFTLAGTTIANVGAPASYEPTQVAEPFAMASFAIVSVLIVVASASYKKLDTTASSQTSPPHSTIPDVKEAASDPLCALSPRERTVIELTLSGASQKEIASLLNISIPSVGTYRVRSYRKLGVTDKSDLIDVLQASLTADGCKNSNKDNRLGEHALADLPLFADQNSLKRNVGKLLALQTACLAPLAIAATRVPRTSSLTLALLAIGCLMLGIASVATRMGDRNIDCLHKQAQSISCMIRLLPLFYGTFFLGVAIAAHGNTLSYTAIVSGFIILSLAESFFLLINHYVELSAAFDMFCAELYRPPFGEQRVCHTLASKGFDADAIEVLNKTLQGKTCSCIAREQLMSTSSVRALRSAAYRAFGAHSKAEFAQNVKQHMEWG